MVVEVVSTRLGDFTVISADPRTVEPDALFDLHAEATITELSSR